MCFLNSKARFPDWTMPHLFQPRILRHNSVSFFIVFSRLIIDFDYLNFWWSFHLFLHLDKRLQAVQVNLKRSLQIYLNSSKTYVLVLLYSLLKTCVMYSRLDNFGGKMKNSLSDFMVSHTFTSELLENIEKIHVSSQYYIHSDKFKYVEIFKHTIVQ